VTTATANLVLLTVDALLLGYEVCGEQSRRPGTGARQKTDSMTSSWGVCTRHTG
jgi:hypothetical protein